MPNGRIGTEIGDEKTLRALVSLLDDDNQRVARAVREKILQIGSAAKPYLAHALREPEGIVRTRARSLLDEIRVGELEREIIAFASRAIDAEGLETGTFLIARLGEPDLDPGPCARRLDEMAALLRERLHGRRGGAEILRGFADFLFTEMRFTGNSLDYYDPQNSYMHRVLDRRTGIPITLSLLYLFLARRVGLRMEGIGLPGHFVVRLPAWDEELFVDAFDSGRVLSRSECARFLVSAGFEPRPEYFVPSSPREILARVLRNLIHIYREGNDKPRVDRLNRLVAVFAKPPTAPPQ